MKIKNEKDFWSGVMFLAFGLGFVVFARKYDMGTAARMGPAYFPTMLGGVLLLLASLSRSGSGADARRQGRAVPFQAAVAWCSVPSLRSACCCDRRLMSSLAALVVISSWAATSSSAGRLLLRSVWQLLVARRVHLRARA